VGSDIIRKIVLIRLRRYAATVTDKSGEYICPPAIPEPGSELAQNEELAEQMMKLTREVVTEKTKKDSVDKGCPMKDY